MDESTQVNLADLTRSVARAMRVTAPGSWEWVQVLGCATAMTAVAVGDVEIDAVDWRAVERFLWAHGCAEVMQ